MEEADLLLFVNSSIHIVARFLDLKVYGMQSFLTAHLDCYGISAYTKHNN